MDVENSHQTGRRLDKDSILMKESCQVKMQTTCISNSSSTHPERETSRPEINPPSGKDGEVSPQARRVSSVISTLMEEPHHVKMQTTHKSDHQKLHPEEYDIMGIDLGKIFKPEENGESSQQIRRLSGVNSNLYGRTSS